MTRNRQKREAHTSRLADRIDNGETAAARSQAVAVLEALALDALALHLAGATDRFGRLAGAALGGLFVVAAKFHLAEHAFALKFLLERLQRLIDVIVTDENLHLADNS
jgi:hypothetical protein